MKYLLLLCLALGLCQDNIDYYDSAEVDMTNNMPMVRSIKRKTRGRVVGGTNAKIEEFPYYVSIRSSGGSPYCGGTILDKTHILTAAHCKVPSGDTVNYGSDIRGGNENVVTVSSSFKHADVKATNVWFMDYLIVTLSEPISLGAKAKIVELGSKSEYDSYVVTNKAECVVVGMGRSGEGGARSYEQTLQKSAQKHNSGMSSAYCGSFYGSLDPRVSQCFLTMGESKGASGCNGDSGGPYFCKISGKWKQFGVASFASTSCNSFTGWWNTFGVLDWIKDNSNFAGGGTSSSGSTGSSRSSASNSAKPSYNTGSNVGSSSSYNTGSTAGSNNYNTRTSYQAPRSNNGATSSYNAPSSNQSPQYNTGSSYGAQRVSSRYGSGSSYGSNTGSKLDRYRSSSAQKPSSSYNIGSTSNSPRSSYSSNSRYGTSSNSGSRYRSKPYQYSPSSRTSSSSSSRYGVKPKPQSSSSYSRYASKPKPQSSRSSSSSYSRYGAKPKPQSSSSSSSSSSRYGVKPKSQSTSYAPYRSSSASSSSSRISCVAANTKECKKDTRGRHYDKCICNSGWSGPDCSRKSYW